MVRKNILIIVFLSLFAPPLKAANDLKNDVLNVAALSVAAGVTGWALYDYYKMPSERAYYGGVPVGHVSLIEGFDDQQLTQSRITTQDILNTYAAGHNNIRFYKPNPIAIDENIINLSSFASARSIVFRNQHSIDALLDAAHKDHFAVRAFAGHELGHIINNDRSSARLKKQVVAATSFAAISLLHFEIVRENLWKVLLPFYFVKRTIDELAFCAIRRYQERRADEHVMQHATNPQELRAMAKNLRADAQTEQENPSRSILLRTHPWATERICTIQAAARKLESQPPQRAL